MKTQATDPTRSDPAPAHKGTVESAVVSGAGQEPVERLAQAAWMYYVDGLTQAEIASAMFVSRPTVGRLLKKARETRVVRIEVDPTHLADAGTANQLRRVFTLADAVVIPAPGAGLSLEEQNDRVAAAAAMYVSASLRPGTVIGLAWGETVQRVLAHLSPPLLEGVTFAALSGGIEYLNARIAAYPEVVDRLRPIPAPLYVSTQQVAETLHDEEFVRTVLELGRTAEATLTSIGTPTTEATIARIGLLPPDELQEVASAGAVGDMLGQWFDSSGHPVTLANGHHHIGLPLTELPTQRNVIGVVAGTHKVEALRAALQGEYLDVVITDEAVAGALLAQGTR